MATVVSDLWVRRRWVLIFAVGVLTGTLAFFIDYNVDNIFEFKYKIMDDMLTAKDVDWFGAYLIVSPNPDPMWPLYYCISM